MALSIDLIKRFKAFAGLAKKERAQWTTADMDQAGAAILIETSIQEQLLSEFTRLEVGDIGVDTVALGDQSATQIPFVASVTWSDRKNAGQFFVQGELLPGNYKSALSGGGSVSAARENMGQLFNFLSLNDDSEKSRRARFAHFTAISHGTRTMDKVDTQTVDLLQSVVAPFVFGEVYLLPITNGLTAELLSNVLGGMSKALTAPPKD
jgi:hypothetical protein